MKNTEPLSNCCHAPFTVSTADEGTSCHICSACKEGCDIASDTSGGEEFANSSHEGSSDSKKEESSSPVQSGERVGAVGLLATETEWEIQFSTWDEGDQIISIRPSWEKAWCDVPIGTTLTKGNAAIVANWLRSAHKDLFKIAENMMHDRIRTLSTDLARLREGYESACEMIHAEYCDISHSAFDKDYDHHWRCDKAKEVLSTLSS